MSTKKANHHYLQWNFLIMNETTFLGEHIFYLTSISIITQSWVQRSGLLLLINYCLSLINEMDNMLKFKVELL